MSTDRAMPTEAALIARVTSTGLAALALLIALRAPTSTAPPAASPSAMPAEFVHDHTPHHGGVVGMVGDRHVEALALADGTIRVYLTDRWRVPLSLDDAGGSVTIGEGDGAKAFELSRAGQRLQARTTALATPTVATRVDLRVANEPVSIDFVLPVGARSGGAVGVPLEGCIAPAKNDAQPAPLGRSARCTLSFATEVTAVATTPDAKRLLLAAVDVGTSMWKLPDVALELGLDQPPPLVMSSPEAPHREAANVIAVSPDSSRAVLALEGRLILYSLADGKVLGELGKGRGVVRDVDWSSDGTLLLVSRFYARAATLLGTVDSTLVRELPVAEEVAAVALSRDSRLAAVGTQRGKIVIFEASSGKALRMLDAGARSIDALAFVSKAASKGAVRLASAGADGVLRVFDVENGESVAAVTLEAPLYRLAAAPDGRTLASGDRVGRVRLHDADGAVIETLAEARNGSSVLDLAFAGNNLVTSDALGTVTVWDESPR